MTHNDEIAQTLNYIRDRLAEMRREYSVIMQRPKAQPDRHRPNTAEDEQEDLAA
jgi:hypothetical protein